MNKPKKTVMTRLLPHPFVSCLLFITWIMLQHLFDSATLLLALVIAIITPKLMQNFITVTPNIQWRYIPKLFFVVLYDIIIANLQVAKLVLSPLNQLHPKWFRVPLDCNHEHVNTLLALIITTTPGTVSAGIDQERGDILVHSLNSHDIDTEIAQIKQRYEYPLIQIFNAQHALDPQEPIR